MRFQAEHQALEDAVGWAARVLPTRPVLPALAGLLIDAAEGNVTLTGFDYEVSARARVEATVSEPGRTLVPGRLLAEIVRSLPDRPVEVAVEGAETVVRCGGAEFGLQTMPAEDHPRIPEPPAAAGTVPGEAFGAAVGRAVVAAGRDDTLPMLTGVRLDIAGETITLACTDRYRLTCCELAWSPARPDFSAAALVPARTLAEAAGVLRTAAEVELSLSDTLLGLSGAGRTLTTRLLDDRFVDYRSRLTGRWTTRAEIPTAPLLEAVERVALVADRNVPVRLTLSGDHVRVHAATGDAARASETLPAELHGEEIDLGFNPRFLLDGLSGIAAAATRLHCTGPAKAVLFTPADEDASNARQAYRYLLMPIRLAA
ncbi:DNA polymerase III subunit beta [Thermomonospora catenispora]|uniref:DNA polymerase III subunit beta n=1 Tax=Thermomonospora catenispora TaxID=2493090 RepID=UPI00111FC4E0|nr:DNA polymerase III subunit beta [Thermomonospora catenispora]TNY37693.1 DNA polymerase III subunit beta [Thermomonospora catenispora]